MIDKYFGVFLNFSGTQYGGSSSWQSYQSPRGAGTLSVLSDDSFMSAFEEFVSEIGISKIIVDMC